MYHDHFNIYRISQIFFFVNLSLVYPQGTEYFFGVVGTAIGYLLAGAIFVPLLYPLGFTSAYEVWMFVFKSSRPFEDHDEKKSDMSHFDYTYLFVCFYLIQTKLHIHVIQI